MTLRRTIVLPVLVALLSAGAGSAGLAAETDEGATLPPLLDRQLFFDDPEISGAQISPDGRYLTFRRPYRGVMNLWVKSIDEGFEAARPLTADDRPVIGYFWSEDSSVVLYVQDKGGNEDFHVYAVDPTAAAEEASGVPPARDLTPVEGVQARIYAVPESTPGTILVGLNDRDPALHDVYRLDLRTGERQRVVENSGNVAAWVTDLAGRVRLAVRQTPDGGTETLEVEDGRLGEVLYSCTFEESCGPVRFHKDGRRVYFISNKGEGVDLTRLLLLDVETRKTTLVESDPEGEVDFGGPVFSDASEELIGTVYVGDRVRVYPRSKRLARALEFLQKELPDGELSFSSITNDDRLAVVSVSRDVDPGTAYLFDWEELTVRKLYASRPELPIEHLAPMQAIRYKARDGLMIPAYLTLPKGVEPVGLSAVVVPHGGPWARDRWGYDPIYQFLANRGYAVLSMNFRGSTGYGKAFLNAGNGEWGTGAMQHDISDGVEYLVERGIADRQRICIMGGSYGGYATLAGLAFTPDLYACGVDIVGPSNIITLLNSIPAYWGPIKKMFIKRVGDPDDPEDAARLKAQSPLFSADKIQAPLLVIQGANDPRVKQAESDQIVVAMRQRERPVEYVVAPDEGHGFRGRENRLAMFSRVEAFLADHLGGRFQESQAPEVAERLASITVDVASVEEPKIATGFDAAKTAPLPPVDAERLRLGKVEYASKLEVQGRELEITHTRTVARSDVDGQRRIEVVSTSQSPMGGGEQLIVLAADSMRPVKSSGKQGPATIEIDFGDRKVTGQIAAGPQTIPIELELEAPAFGDDAALDCALASLPLSDGYKTSVRVVEVGMQQRVRYFSLRVAGQETVEVPAGTFDTYRLELEPLDGEGGGKAIWVSAEAPRTVVKSEGRLPPQMGGGSVTTVLTAVVAAD